MATPFQSGASVSSDAAAGESRLGRWRRRVFRSAQLVGLAAAESAGAFGFVWRHRLVMHVLLVFVITFVLFVGLWILGWKASGALTEVLLRQVPEAKLAEWCRLTPERMHTILYFLGHIFVGIPLKFFFLLFHMPLVQAVGFPIFDRLSEDVDAALAGRPAVREFKWRRYLLMLATVGIPNLLSNFVRSGLYYLLSLIPIVGLFFFARGFLLNAYFSGYGVLENFHENRGLDPVQSREAIRARRELAMGIGLFTNLLGMLPFVGNALGATLGIVGGGIALHRTEQREKAAAAATRAPAISPASAAPC